MQMVKSQAIGNYFLDKSIEDKKPLTNLKLQKLVYIAYGFYSYFGPEQQENKLFPETIEAWKHGPVMPALYHEAKRYGSNSLEQDFKFSSIIEIDNKDSYTEIGDSKVEIIYPNIDNIDDEETKKWIKAILELVWHKYNKYTGWTLRNLTHRINSPWYQTYDNGKGEYKQIPFKTIKDYYAQFIDGLLNDK